MHPGIGGITPLDWVLLFEVGHGLYERLLSAELVDTDAAAENVSGASMHQHRRTQAGMRTILFNWLGGRGGLKGVGWQR